MLGRHDLRMLADAAEDHRQAHAVVVAIDLQAVADLQRELARRRQDERARRARLELRAVEAQPLQQRQAERGGLAGAGLGDAEHVAS